MGYFTVEGTLTTAQFWPTGTADADTTNIKVTPTAFFYAASKNGPRRRVKGLDSAYSVGKSGKSAVVKNGKMTVRLQGIDAPELHYRPTLTGNDYTTAQRERFKNFNEDYRQAYAETATSVLGSFVKSIGAEIPCVISTQVDRPTDVFDVYGRFVGDVLVRRGSQSVNLNLWTLKKGLAVPGIYNSMTRQEIRDVLTAYQQGLPTLKKSYSAQVVRFNDKRIFRRKPANPAPDVDARDAKFFLPKLFRRQAMFYALSSAKIISGSFVTYLASLRDDYVSLDDFVRYGKDAEKRPIKTMVNSRNRVLDPDRVVFIESESRLFDAQGRFMSEWRFS